MAADEAAAANRPRRVRTGCLTCRERHLKCDEGTPDCQNCRKSSRICKRGVRLNFIDITTEQPPVMPISHEWKVHFQDESRDIASEYAGGVKRYASYTVHPTPPSRNSPPTPRSGSSHSSIPATTISHPTLPPILPLLPASSMNPNDTSIGQYIKPEYEEPKPQSHHRASLSYSYAPSAQVPPTPPSTMAPEHTISPPPKETKSYLNNPEETYFMQVFVEEVGIWMDSLDPLKHFSRLLPFDSLSEPMLLNAFLACGARHLVLVNPTVHEDKALHYYDTATRLILASLQNPNRDTQICATTAIILNVYEIMSERPLQRMNHIAGARALLRECGWNARTQGVGGACFWLNVSMELLSCLRFNWSVAWDPDEWGVDMDFNQRTETGREELWAHRIIYILAKIVNFKASLAAFFRRQQEASDQIYMNNEVQKNYEEWRRLRDLCMSWNENIPRNMHPMAFLHPYQTSTKSAFPEVWLIKRCAIVARLFYHTAMYVLAQINPYGPSDEMHDMALSNAHQICGIAAHVKDRGVASTALRSLATVSECLSDRREQEEVLEIFTKIKKETGWRVNFIYKELKEKWGWEVAEPLPQPSSLLQSASLHRNPTPPQYTQFQQLQQHQSQQQPQQQHQQQHQHQHQHQHQQHQQQQSQQQHQHQHQQQQQQPPPPQPQMRRLPQLANPLLAATDRAHPYHPHYVSAPQQHVDRHSYI